MSENRGSLHSGYNRFLKLSLDTIHMSIEISDFVPIMGNHLKGGDLSRPYSVSKRKSFINFRWFHMRETMQELGMHPSDLFQEFNSTNWVEDPHTTRPKKSVLNKFGSGFSPSSTLWLEPLIMLDGTPEEIRHYIIDLQGLGNVTASGKAKGNLLLTGIHVEENGKKILTPSNIYALPPFERCRYKYDPDDIDPETGFLTRYGRKGKFDFNTSGAFDHYTGRESKGLRVLDLTSRDRYWGCLSIQEIRAYGGNKGSRPVIDGTEEEVKAYLTKLGEQGKLRPSSYLVEV